MSEHPQRIIFNHATRRAFDTPQSTTSSSTLPDGSAAGVTVHVYTSDPVVQLEAVAYTARPRRVQPQLEELERLGLQINDPVFGNALDRPFCEYTVSVLSEAGRRPGGTLPPAQVLGTDPSQPVLAPPQPAAAEGTSQTRLCLFNVIVALEWQASPEYVQQLKWALRRASDFLYDVTDGYFAFGQVVIGGPELMNCADIQIMASNRLLPRSWVSGLHEPHKYMPIRVGRGIWHKNNRVSIPWDEPEGYRTLVHEWAHYALELRDAYLETCRITLDSRSGSANGSSDSQGDYALVIPQISITTESIMATLEGTSELVPQIGSNGGAESAWAEIIKRNRYRFLNFDPNHRTLEGPGRLPLPLPTCHVVGSLAAGQSPSTSAEAMLVDVPEQVRVSNCWVYVIKGSLVAPQNLIAQGSLDARTRQRGFRLLGVAPGDTVVLLAKDQDWQTLVLTATIDAITTGESGGAAVAKLGQWANATPTQLPMIDVISGSLHHNDQLAELMIHVTEQPEQTWVFPLGQATPQTVAPNTFTRVPTLDGHVLATWQQGGKLAISSFSQGGNPQTGTPTGGPPITAGSSEGNSMIFFGNKEQRRDYSDTKIVTTLVHADPQLDALPDGAQARSYAFSLACNTVLPTEFDPTLILYFDRDTLAEQGELVIYRQTDLDGATWMPVPTHRPVNSFFVAAPLNEATAARLVAADSATRVERYRLYWKPGSATQSD
jgi:hypothetical protein